MPSETALKRIEFWKSKLIDLSLRNKLLNYRPRSSSSVKIVDEVPRVVVDRLLEEEGSFGFLPKPEAEPAPDGGEEFVRIEDDELTHAQRDLYLQTTSAKGEMDRALYNLFLKSRTSFEEQGVVTLFLAVGMLRWFVDEDEDSSHLAPILLLPVTLTRPGAGRPFSLAAAPADPEVNPSLLRKLQVDFGVAPRLPDTEGGTDPDAILEAFRNCVPDKRWQVLSDMHLSLFSFSKYLMYRDLEDQADKLLGSPVVSRLAGEAVSEEMQIATEAPDPTELDRLRHPSEVHQILDADSSQQTAIETVRRGVSLVLQGPPGTGKSQTIANLVAEMLADGKSVLFASEKMAALEVVKRRLDQAGLGDYVLELHSRHAAKRGVVDELKRCLERDRAGEPREMPELDHLPEARAELREYIDAVHSPFGAGGIAPFEALGVLARLERARDVPFAMEEPEALSPDDRRNRARLLSDLARARTAVEPRGGHPWRFSRLTSVSRANEIELGRRLGSLEERVDRLADLAGDRVRDLGLPPVEDLDGAERLAALLAHLSRSPNPDRAWVLDGNWAGGAAEGRALAEKASKYAAGRGALLEHYEEGLFDLALSGLAERRRRHGTSIFRFLRPSWWGDRKVIKSVRRAGARRKAQEEIEDLELAARVKDWGDDLDGEAARGEEIFGRFWKGRNSDGEELGFVGEWVAKLRGLSPLDPPPTELAGAAADPRAFDGAAAELREALARVREDRDATATLLKAGETADDLEELSDWARIARSRMEEIHDWASYRRALEEARAAGLTGFLEAAEREGLGTGELADAYEKAFHSLFLDRARAERAALRDFDRRRHEEAIRRFQALDVRQLDLAAGRIRARLDAALPSRRSFSPESDVGLLLREAAKKRRHMPIRKLLDRAGAAVRRLKPCFMMSPLSIAQYLPPSTEPFDLIVFDEASQICPEDAIGAIARGKQVVVVGDSKQLPPTSFFSYDPDTEEAEDAEDPPPDLESILDLCATSGVPGLRLRFHYRSRDESLIAFSNHHFYDDGLFTFPNPGDRPGLGVEFIHVPDGIYDRGKTRANRVEAMAVAQGIAEHLKAEPDQSVGAVTFSEAQQRAVLEEVEKLRQADPDLEELWERHPEEPPFVKNLENVQGDERDVMFFSVGYGRDAGGKLLMNFGPLNGEGGHRRLNVAVTRAKRAVRVYSSILPEDIDVDRVSRAGARLLRDYLAYARYGVATLRDEAVAARRDSGPSVFETAVANSLEAEGFRVTSRVGTSGFRLDLAVARPEVKDRFLLGIQSDGTSYRDAATARDRDRTRPLVLDRLGWNLTRVWSADWVRSPRREVERLVALIEAGPEREEPAPPPPKGREEEEDGENESRSPAEADLPGVATYRVTPKSHRRTRKKFDPDNPDIPDFVNAIVSCEGPIHEELLARRIAETFRTRTTQKVREATRLAALRTAREGLIDQRGDFYWPAGKTECPVRKPAKGERPRDIDHVPDEEIEDAVRLVLGVDLRLPRPALLKAAGNLLGYRRPSDEVLARAESVVARLVSRGEIEEEEDLVGLPEA